MSEGQYKRRGRGWLLACTMAAMLPTAGQAQQPAQWNAIAYRIPMICSAVARLEADEYPGVRQTFDDWEGFEDFEQAERALHGFDWWSVAIRSLDRTEDV